jgi:hypothetical protein
LRLILYLKRNGAVVGVAKCLIIAKASPSQPKCPRILVPCRSHLEAVVRFETDAEKSTDEVFYLGEKPLNKAFA